MVVVGEGDGGQMTLYCMIFIKYIPYAQIKKWRVQDRIPLPSLEISNLINSYDNRKIIQNRPSNDPKKF